MLLRKLVAKKTLLQRKLVAKINFATLSPGSSAHASAASLSMQKTFAIPAGVAAFHSNQLLSAFQSKNMPLIEQAFITEVFSISIYRKSLKKATLLRE
ncbi:hypothetical protein AN959_17095 [Psychrobacillus sp. FJAT-21963]|nr:hypothetical protein AN959_17095 [Psychrobacillus sp. FJAT-21963]